jgi:hypothetical protein
MNDPHAFLRYVYWKLDFAIPCDQHLEFFQFLQDQPETATILLRMLPKLVRDFQKFSISGYWMKNGGNKAAQQKDQKRDIKALKCAIDTANKRIEKEKQKRQMEREWTRLLRQIDNERNRKSQQSISSSIVSAVESGDISKSTTTSRRKHKSIIPCPDHFHSSGFSHCDRSESKCQK